MLRKLIETRTTGVCLCVGALGSPGFVSPEAVNDKPHTLAMDIFSLGVVAFVMLVGRKPFSIQVTHPLRHT